MDIILASTSPSRRQLMDSLQIPYRTEAPGVEENVPFDMPVETAVTHLAEKKARAVFDRNPKAWVIGADQLVSLNGRAVGKPVDRAAAKQQLQSMSGRTHRIATGLCFMGPQFFRLEVDLVTLSVFPLSDEELERYLDLEEWRGCAGSYRIEAAGQALFSSMEGDRTSVMGLPLLRVVRALRDAGFAFFPSSHA